MERNASIPPSPGNLYTLAFLALVLKLHSTTLNGPVRKGLFRHFGRIVPGGVSRPVYVVTAVQLSQWLVTRRGHGWHVDPDALDLLLQRCCEFAGDAIPKSQRHVRDTPFDQLVWLSNYAWHGGRTVQEVDAE